MSNTNVIYLEEVEGIDPILRKGHTVKIRDINLYGIVVAIQEVLGPDSPAAGQASVVNIAVPFDEGWEIHEYIAVDNITRVVRGGNVDVEDWEEEKEY